jgi:hypothetical protein
MNTPRGRHVGLAVAAAFALAAAAWVSLQDEQSGAVAPPARQSTVQAKPETPAPPVPDAKLELRRALFPDAPADPFAARSWTPPVVEKPAAPAAPVAPPLPYTYFGRMTEDGKLYVFLQRGERSYTAKPGDVLDQQYRVDDITSTAVMITYLPLKQRQVLHTGS